jgi:UPF0176 protein
VLEHLSFYSFFEVTNPEAARQVALQAFRGQGVLGTVLLAGEGVNLQLCGPAEALNESVESFLDLINCPKPREYHRSIVGESPFRQFKVKIKPEIVTLKEPTLNVPKLASAHIDPTDFAALLKNPPKGLRILDTRNDYEFRRGTFKGAEQVPTKAFHEFKDYVADPKNDLRPTTPIVMFCTGGVRCEKASAYLRTQGFESVQQLKGGVLGYFSKVGSEHFDGELFVFDDRETVKG